MVIAEKSTPDYLNLTAPAERGLTPAGVRNRCPLAGEQTGLDGLPCSSAEDLEPLWQEVAS
jgi:hypothetical protein